MKSWFVLFALLNLAGCGGVSWNSKMTVTVEIDGRQYSGSGVVKAKPYNAGPLTQGDGFIARYCGEAVIVNLDERGYLFALWHKPPNPLDAAFMRGSFSYAPERDGSQSISRRRTKAWREFAKRDHVETLSPEQLPLMVRFKNISDPDSVLVIDSIDTFEKALGPTARVTQVTVERTSESVSEGNLKQVIPWIFDPPTWLGPRNYFAGSDRNEDGILFSVPKSEFFGRC